MGRLQKIKKERKLKEKEKTEGKGRIKSIIIKSIVMFIVAILVAGGITFAIAYKDRGIEAKVGSTVVKKAEIEKRVEAIKNQYRSMGIDPDDPQYKSIIEQIVEQTRNDLINQAVIEEYAKRNNIKPTEEEIKKEVDRQIENIKSGFKSEEEYEKALAQSRFKNEENLRKEIEKYVIPDILERKVLAPVYSKIKVTEEDALKYFNEITQVHARHILIKVPEDADEKTVEEKKKLAEEIREKILKGADFAEMAKKYSDDPGSKDKGGDLGWFGKGKMVKEFEEAAFSLKPGEISPVIKTKYGFHIIQVLDVKTKGETYDKPERVKVKHILLKIDKNMTPEDRTKKQQLAEKIYNELLNGANFDELVKKYSEDEATKDKGGELGEVAKGSRGEEWDKNVFTLKKGEFSKPFLTSQGYEIVFVEDKLPEVKAKFEDVKDDIIKTLETKRRNEAKRKWLEEKKKEFGVKEGNLWDEITSYLKKHFLNPLKNWLSKVRESVQENSGENNP